jgi:hypothetical protein
MAKVINMNSSMDKHNNCAIHYTSCLFDQETQEMLKVKDPKMADDFLKQQSKTILFNSHIAAVSRLIYWAFMMVDMFRYGIAVQRVIQFLMSTLVNYMMNRLADKERSLLIYIAPCSIMTFATFIFNPGCMYNPQYDPMLLMIGYVSISYISCCFLSLNWEVSTQYHAFSTILVTIYYQQHFEIPFNKLFPAMLLLVGTCSLISFQTEKISKKEFIHRMHSINLEKDLKKVLNTLPEGVIISTREKQSRILLNNLEACRMMYPQPLEHNIFEKSLGTGKLGSPAGSSSTYNHVPSIRDLSSDILTEKRLLPYLYMEENMSQDDQNKYKINTTKPISVEEALIFGEVDRFYYVINPDQINESFESLAKEEMEVVGLNLINIQFEQKDCHLILLKNWTSYFRYQLSKQAQKIQEMITATISHEMRTPINSILTMIESLMLINEDYEHQRMCSIIKNSGTLLLYLVNDMLDAFMLKTGKFDPILSNFSLYD